VILNPQPSNQKHMSKSQTINMENKRSQRNMTPQSVNNNTVEDIVDSEADESSVVEVRRIIRMYKKYKEDIYKDNSMNSNRKWIKKTLEDTEEAK
jgi:formaldehyde-activating enzyme involved in methanogenesis